MIGVWRLGVSVLTVGFSVTLSATATTSLFSVEVLATGCEERGVLSVLLGDSGREVTIGEAGGRFFSLVFGGGVLLVLLWRSEVRRGERERVRERERA